MRGDENNRESFLKGSRHLSNWKKEEKRACLIFYQST